MLLIDYPTASITSPYNSSKFRYINATASYTDYIPRIETKTWTYGCEICNKTSNTYTWDTYPETTTTSIKYGYYKCTGYFSGNSTSDNFSFTWKEPESPRSRLRREIRERCAPTIILGRTAIQSEADQREFRARETLRVILGEEKYRAFLRNGFVSVRAKSGKIYQIFPGHKMTNVYLNGQLVERLCVVLQGNFPPTDSLIMRYLLILNDEQDFHMQANRFTAIARTPTHILAKPQESLADLCRKLKAA